MSKSWDQPREQAREQARDERDVKKDSMEFDQSFADELKPEPHNELRQL